MPNKIDVKIKQTDLKTCKWDDLKPFQDDFKNTNEMKIRKLANSIKKHGLFLPKYVWCKDGILNILDGHQTRKAFELLEQEGYDIPPVPYIEIKAKNIKDAKEKLLQINSRYADIDPESLFLSDMSDIFEEIEIPEIDLDVAFVKDEEVEQEIQKPYKYHHILISIPINKYNNKIISLIEDIENIEGVEIEKQTN